ncbi:MAG TPA: hypothetical protein VMY35_07650 [Phycisphaerae bacterium]|nr:hypothetical protein [Phycisphaerae bacterium]
MAIGQLLMAGPARRKRKKDTSWEGLTPKETAVHERRAIGRSQGVSPGKLDAMFPVPTRAPSDQAAMAREGEAATARARPASYYVEDPTARAQLEAKERVAGRKTITEGYDPYRLDPYGQPAAGRGLMMSTPAPGTESAWEPERMKRIAGETERGRLLAAGVDPYGPTGAPPQRLDPRTGRPPTEAEMAGQAGGPALVKAGTVMPTGEGADPYLRGRYVGRPLTVAEQGTASETQRRLQVMNAPAYDPRAVAALRAQRGPWEGRRTIEDIATEQAGGQLMRTQARGAGAMATMLEAQALPAQQMLELWQTPEGKQQVMAMWATGSQQEKQAYAAQVLAEVGANLPPEIQQALAEAASGYRVEEYDGSWWQTGGVLGSVWDFLAGLVRGAPTMRRAVPATGAGLITGPTAAPGLPATGPNAPGAPLTGQFGFRGGIGQPAVQAGAGQLAAADQEERELYERLKLKYGG